jgi:hypothetical protein
MEGNEFTGLGINMWTFLWGHHSEYGTLYRVCTNLESNHSLTQRIRIHIF